MVVKKQELKKKISVPAFCVNKNKYTLAVNRIEMVLQYNYKNWKYRKSYSLSETSARDFII